MASPVLKSLDWHRDSPEWLTFSCLVLGTVLYLVKWFNNSKYKTVPTVGPSAPILSYLGALRFFRHGGEMIQEGYNKYRGGVFKVANHNQWHMVVTGPKLIDEVRRAPDNVLSFHDAINENFNVKYTVGPSVANNTYHIPIVRTVLTRNLGLLFSDIRDELAESCRAVIPAEHDKWIKVRALPAIMQIVARTSSRIFVGLPLCRDPDWNQTNTKFAVDVVKAAMLINLFPKFLRPLVAKFFISVPASIKRAQHHLEPVINERYQCMEKYGDSWAEKPNDMLQWLIDEAVGDEKKPHELTLRILTVSFAAIHTSSMSFTHALYRLAAFPEYAQPLRDEIEHVVEQEGWTKHAMQKMRKVDSFLKECQRVYGLGSLTMLRKAMVDFTFSDGSFVPKGSFISVAVAGTHTDGEYYENPFEFDPWRFANMRDEDGEEMKHQMVNTSLEYIAFGLGRHACPGRFFAANELKALLAHIVMNYDVKMEKEGQIPPSVWYTNSRSPNRDAEVLFRKRQK